MRKVLMVYFCLLSVIASATDYYVSSSGNDSANGLSSSTPWRSISKVNAFFPSLRPGDRILFKRGETFYGTIKVSRSGASGSPITISSYGTGDNPVITGFTSLTGWDSYGNGIYYKSVTCESKPNIVTVNGTNTPIGRWPNTGFLSIDSHSSITSITDSELPSSPDWTGAEVVIRKVPYIYDRNTITDHSGNTLYYSSGSDYSPRDNYGYFIQNDINTLDKQGEWYYDGSTFYQYFGTGNPENYNVKVSSLDQLANVNSQNFITFDNLSFEGGNEYAVQISNSGNITIQNCRISFTGNIAIFGPWYGNSPYCKIKNNIIDNSNNMAIKLCGDHTYATIDGNTITNTGLIVGMGGSGDGTYISMDILGDNSLIQYNRVENSGYIGISFSGNNALVTNNLVNRFNLFKNDGGGIYTYVGTGTPRTGQKVINNIVLNGYGYGEGEPDKSTYAAGFYMDDRSRNITLSYNTAAFCSTSGIYLHNAHEIVVNNNTLFDNGSGQYNYGCQMLFVHDGYSPDDPIRNVSMTNNIFFAKSAAQKVLSFSTISDDISSFGTADNNCYARPIDNSAVAKTWEGGWNSESVNRSLTNWQSYTGKDQNSYVSPVSVSDEGKIRFEYNASSSNKVISLDKGYIDVKGTKYSGSLTLLPYTSVVLIEDPNPAAPPPAPLYLSSSVENAAPSVIEMNYNLTLAAIVPNASAFSVQVNSSQRSITSVKISGTKVLLTLSSPVVNGNTVTVSYTVPASNPLQTPAGGKAATISARPVTNRVNPVSTPPVVTPPPVPNTPPVVMVNYTSKNFSGFVGTLNASGSYDANNDRLTYQWKVPSGISVSSTNNTSIDYLAPIVETRQKVEFILTVSDGKTTTSKSIPIDIEPFQPGLERAGIVSVEAGDSQSAGDPNNIIDGNTGTMWAANGFNQWVVLELDGLFNIQHVKLSFQPGQKRESYFDIFGSNDKERWDPIIIKSRSCAFSGDMQVFEFPASKSSNDYRFVKLIGQGNSADTWNYVSEFRIFGYRHKDPKAYEDQFVKIYPNPARDIVNFTVDEESFIPDFIKIVTLTGKTVYDDKIAPGIRDFQLQVDFREGIYIVQMGTGDLTMFTQKIIISR